MYRGEGTGLKLRPHLVTDEQELAQAVEAILQEQFVVVDVETTSLDVQSNEVIWVGLSTIGQRYLVPLGHPLGYLITPEHTKLEDDMSTVRPFKKDPTKFTKPKKMKVKYEAVYEDAPVQMAPHRAFKIMEPLFFSDKLVKVGHNFKFDLQSIAKYYGGRIASAPYVDTVILLHIVDENRTDYKLKHYIGEWMLGKRGLNAEARAAYYPDLGKSIMTSPFDWVAGYLQMDVTHTQRVYLDLLNRCDEKLLRVLHKEMEVYTTVMQMEYDGASVDMGAIDAFGDLLRAEQVQIETDIGRIAGHRVEDLSNINVRKDLLFLPEDKGGQGLKPLAETGTGKPRLNKEDLEVFAQTNELAQLFQKWGENDKLLSTFVVGFDQFVNPRTHRVHASFKQHGTVTGRSSCSNPNLQQVPARTEKGRAFRKAFVPRGSGTFIVCDFDQIELRLLAYLSGDPEMIGLFARGDDIHRGAAAGMYQIPDEEVTGGQRDNGKTLNFAIGYGAQAKKLSTKFGVTVREAEAMISNYYKRFKRLEPWKLEIISAAVETGDRRDPERFPPYVEIPPFGRRRRLPGLFIGDTMEMWKAERQAVNAVSQGYAAYVMKQALIDVDRNLREAELPSRIVLQVHDEIAVECDDESYAEATYEAVVAGMQDVKFFGKPALGNVPLLASGGIGPNWVDAKKG